MTLQRVRQLLDGLLFFVENPDPAKIPAMLEAVGDVMEFLEDLDNRLNRVVENAHEASELTSNACERLISIRGSL